MLWFRKGCALVKVFSYSLWKLWRVRGGPFQCRNSCFSIPENFHVLRLSQMLDFLNWTFFFTLFFYFPSFFPFVPFSSRLTWCTLPRLLLNSFIKLTATIYLISKHSLLSYDCSFYINTSYFKDNHSFLRSKETQPSMFIFGLLLAASFCVFWVPWSVSVFVCLSYWKLFQMSEDPSLSIHLQDQGIENMNANSSSCKIEYGHSSLSLSLSHWLQLKIPD